jgi:hypothetical protein
MTECRLKVGDKVRIINRDCSFSWHPDMEEYFNLSAEITRIDGKSIKLIKLDIDRGFWSWSENQFELVPHSEDTPKKTSSTMEGGETMAKYRVGDKVRIVDKDWHWGSLRYGSITTIEKVIDEHGYDINDPAQETTWCAKEKDLASVSHTTVIQRMSTRLSILAKKLLDSDIKKLVEVGWLSPDLQVTETGMTAAFTHYVLAHKEELAKEARKVLRELEKERADEE